jgi:hypothetical protein
MRRSKFSIFKKGPKPIEATPVTLHMEPTHDDSDTITASTFPFNELIPTWSTFNPNTKNGATGSTFASGHHGSSGCKKLSDFKSFRIACCLEYIDKEVEGVRRRVRCMNVFTVDSNQCITHGKTTHKDGPNRIYTLMKRNETASWGMLRDTDAAAQACEAADWLLEQRLRDAAAARLDKAAENGEHVDAVWKAESAVVSTKVKIAKKQKSFLTHGRIALDCDVEVGTVVHVKGKTSVNGKKGAKSRWKGTQLGPIFEK